MLKGKGTELTLEFGSGGKVLHTEKITLDRKAHASDSGLARRIWAQKKIAELELRPNKHEDEITELGKEHSIVTRNTSLIVLDRLEDYVTHRIMPPEADLRQQYLAKIEQQQKKGQKTRGTDRRRNQEIRAKESLGGTRPLSSVRASPKRVTQEQ